jgi:uncharacterized protein YbbC (DUF1343 family)
MMKRPEHQARMRHHFRGVPLWAPLLSGICFVFVLMTAPTVASQVQMGVDVFLSSYTHLVKDARVGLITNKTGRTMTGASTVDALSRHPNVNLVALFAPEHGIEGQIEAGKHVGDSRLGNLPVFSLYGGGSKRPKKAALDQVDVMVYDIQDVGSRAYTFIWSLAEVMAAAAEYDKRVIVLDRPNPLGGLTVDGPVSEEKWLSFIGLYPIPRVYGLTVGELAWYLNREHGIGCTLTVVPMDGYRRNMRWSDFSDDWEPTSQYIPSPESAVCFAATGTIGTLGTLHIGIGTEIPFQVVGAPWVNAEATARALNLMRLPGVRFRPMTFVPEMWLFRGKTVRAVFLDVVDPVRFQPTRTEVAMLAHFVAKYPEFKIPKSRYNDFDKAMGTSTVREAILRRDEARQIWMRWSQQVLDFSMVRQKYLLYRSGDVK